MATSINEQRAAAAEVALKSYANAKGNDPYASTTTTLTDLLADFMHFTSREGLDFGVYLAIAEYHFAEENGTVGRPNPYRRMT